MKTITITLILILVCVSVILIGCVKKDKSVVLLPGFNQDVVKEKSLNIGDQTSFTRLKVELEDFKSFGDEFFPVWTEYMSIISVMLDDFNNCTILEEKFKNSEILEKKYLEFKFRLENIKPPSIALQAKNIAIEAVSYRILFFKKFNENASIDELNEIENKAYLTEISFWDEVDRIYKYFDEEYISFDIEDDYKYIVLN
ncbi:MAG: hypothetical protein ACYCXB_02485 [Candidatus Humimicrobiaceae bacterium]